MNPLLESLKLDKSANNPSGFQSYLAEYSKYKLLKKYITFELLHPFKKQLE